MKECNSLDDIRVAIDDLDREIVRLIVERGEYVKSAAKYKKNTDAVRAPQRVEAVISKVRSIAVNSGGTPDIIEKTYRAMIAAFIEAELTEYSKNNTSDHSIAI